MCRLSSFIHNSRTGGGDFLPVLPSSTVSESQLATIYHSQAHIFHPQNVPLRSMIEKEWNSCLPRPNNEGASDKVAHLISFCCLHKKAAVADLSSFIEKNISRWGKPDCQWISGRRLEKIRSLIWYLEMASGSKSDDETSRLVSSVNECTRAWPRLDPSFVSRGTKRARLTHTGAFV